jgi:hypothetical protein
MEAILIIMLGYNLGGVAMQPIVTLEQCYKIKKAIDEDPNRVTNRYGSYCFPNKQQPQKTGEDE